MGATRLDDLDTPCLTVDLDVFERNVRTCLSNLARVHVRPHLKTAKSPDVARLLIDAGAVGVCVAKLSEAEVMLGSGIDDVLITTEIAGEVKVRRLARLIAEEPAARVRIVVDSWDGATAIDAVLPRPLETLIDVNVGQDRCGIAPEDALALADRIRGLERLRLIGVQGYEGHLQHVRDATERRSLCDTAMGRLGAVADELSSAGHAITVVTTGGTGTAQFCAVHSFVTEVQPGSFAFMDTDYLDTGGLPYESSLHVIATVISRPAGDRAVIDAGLKTLSDDSGPARLLDAPGWSYHHAGDEHGKLTPIGESGARELRVGDRVRLIPSHIDPTINLHDVMYAHRGGRIESEWAVAARGKVQ